MRIDQQKSEHHDLEELESGLGSATPVDIGIEGVESGQFTRPPSVPPTSTPRSSVPPPTVVSLTTIGLEEVDSRGEVALHRIVTPEFRIGRHPECNLVLHEDSKISRRHARIARLGDECLIEDNESVNGTFVNGQKLTQAAQLKHGDKVRVGSHEFTYICGATQPDTLRS